MFHGLAQGGAERAVESGLVIGGAQDLWKGGEFVEREVEFRRAGHRDLVGGRGVPWDGSEELRCGLAESDEVVPPAGGGTDDHLMAVELDKGGVDPAGGDLDAIGPNHRDFLVTFLESLLEGPGESLGVVPLALGMEVDDVRIEHDFGPIHDFGQDPEFDRILGIVGGEAEADPAFREAGELAKEDAHEGLVDGDGSPGAQCLGDPGFDLTRDWFLDEDEQEAVHEGIQPCSQRFGHRNPLGWTANGGRFS